MFERPFVDGGAYGGAEEVGELEELRGLWDAREWAFHCSNYKGEGNAWGAMYVGRESMGINKVRYCVLPFVS